MTLVNSFKYKKLKIEIYQTDKYNNFYKINKLENNYLKFFKIDYFILFLKLLNKS